MDLREEKRVVKASTKELSLVIERLKRCLLKSVFLRFSGNVFTGR